VTDRRWPPFVEVYLVSHFRGPLHLLTCRIDTPCSMTNNRNAERVVWLGFRVD
jgi:hypothetical protein